MSDVNSLFKKKKGKSKALDLNAATTAKKPSKSKAEKQKEAAEDEEWKTETKKTVVLTNGKAVEEFGKKYNEDEVYEEDLDMKTKIDIDDTRKMLRDVMQRSAEADSASEEKVEKEKSPEVVNLKTLSFEDRFARASANSKYVARGPTVPKKNIEEEYPSLGASVAKSNPAPSPKKRADPLQTKASEDSAKPSSEGLSNNTTDSVPLSVFRASEGLNSTVEITPPVLASSVIEEKCQTNEVLESVVDETAANVVKEGEATVKKEKKKKKKGAAFEI